MDKKIETFLTVCRTMNYREAAEQLHLTQPAVTKQIQALEAEYGAKLFRYDGRRLHKTDQGLILESYAHSLEYNYQEMQLAMQEKERLHVKIGATKTIGDYVIAPAIVNYLKDPSHEITLIVDNTVQLLKGIDDGELDFAIVEGRFNKNRYSYQLMRNEPFIGIAAPSCAIFEKKREQLPENKVKFEDLFGETIIVREKGSGTRELFERDLESLGFSLDSFARVVELSSFILIRSAVREGVGISFVYQSVVKDEAGFEHFLVDGMQRHHEFNIVSLRNTKARHYADKFLSDAGLLNK